MCIYQNAWICTSSSGSLFNFTMKWTKLNVTNLWESPQPNGLNGLTDWILSWTWKRYGESSVATIYWLSFCICCGNNFMLLYFHFFLFFSPVIQNWIRIIWQKIKEFFVSSLIWSLLHEQLNSIKINMIQESLMSIYRRYFNNISRYSWHRLVVQLHHQKYHWVNQKCGCINNTSGWCDYYFGWCQNQPEI